MNNENSDTIILKPCKKASDLKLRFDFQAMMFLDEKGIKILEGIDENQMKDFGNLKTLVHAGLLYKKDDITEEEALNHFKGLNFVDIVNAITEAITESVGADEVPDDEESIQE